MYFFDKRLYINTNTYDTVYNNGIIEIYGQNRRFSAFHTIMSYIINLKFPYFIVRSDLEKQKIKIINIVMKQKSINTFYYIIL